MASVKKVVKSIGAAKKWLAVMAKILITTIQVNIRQIPNGGITWMLLILLMTSI